MNKAEEQIQKGREAEAQMVRKMETLQQELDNMNRKIEQIQKGTGFGARANRQMNFGRGSDYSGSRNSRNSRELSNQANQRKASSNTRPGYGSYSRPTVNRSAERSGSNNTRPSKATYVPIHLRGQQKGPSPVRPSNVTRTSPNQRGGSNTRTSPTIPVQGNRFGVNYRGQRELGGASNSRDRVPQINRNYQMKNSSPSTGGVFDRLYGRREGSG